MINKNASSASNSDHIFILKPGPGLRAFQINRNRIDYLDISDAELVFEWLKSKAPGLIAGDRGESQNDSFSPGDPMLPLPLPLLCKSDTALDRDRLLSKDDRDADPGRTPFEVSNLNGTEMRISFFKCETSIVDLTQMLTMTHI